MSVAKPTATIRREVYVTSAFKKDLKKAKDHKKCNLSELQKVMKMLEIGQALDRKYSDHPLIGRYPDRKGSNTDCRDCHTSNDWILVYRLPDDKSIQFIRTGTHSKLF